MNSMKQEREHLIGDQLISEGYELWGKVTGDVRVVDGGKLYMRGAINGDLIVQDGGRVHVFGYVSGDMYVFPGTKVIHSGVIGGSAFNEGGRLYIDRDAIVTGRIKTNSGDTQIEPKDVMPDEDDYEE